MKHSKILKYTLIAIAIMLVTMFILAAIFFFFPINARHRSSTSIEDYGRFIREMGPLYCMSFPDESLISEDNCVFYDKYRFDGSNTPQYLTYALCTFSEEVFNLEVSRLADLASEYSETYFAIPAYILYLDYVGSSEYALVDENSLSIHYVCFSSNRFLDQLPVEDRIKSEYRDLEVNFRDLDYYYDLFYR